jgi:hypothetical protein
VKRALEYCRANPTFVAFMLLAVFVRIVFWAYTGRTWEDALITLTPARNAWEGFGLTHHASEPRVHSFTSPISVLIPLIGEAIGQGLLLQKLTSLLAAIPTIYYAYRIGETLSFSTGATVFLLAYLALDFHQVFFGMGGMETQVAVAVALANAYYLLTAQWWKLGLACGAGLLSRPEFAFWLPIVGVTVLILQWRAIYKVVLGTILVAGPWFAFATAYYGSPIPHTIVAKSQSFELVLGSFGWHAPLKYFFNSWRHVAPFLQTVFTIETPVPEMALRVVVYLLFALFALGIVRAARGERRLLAVALFVIVFLAHRASTLIPSYYMWYLPPFVALLAVVAAYGLSWLGRWPSLAVGSALAFAYALPLPLALPIERDVQVKIEDGVRRAVGLELNRLMGPNDTAALEPLGYAGWFARNKTIYDFPGLGSPTAAAAVKGMRPHGSLGRMIDVLKPTFIILRPYELPELKERFPQTFALYREVRQIGGPPPKLENMGLRYGTVDALFFIFKKASSE